MDLNKLKFDFVYLDPPYNVDFHELVLNQLFNCNLLKKDSTVICEHSPNVFIKKSTLWETIDIRNSKKAKTMIEPLLCGIVLGLVPITLLGLFVSAWNQYRRGSGMLDID